MSIELLLIMEQVFPPCHPVLAAYMAMKTGQGNWNDRRAVVRR